jgi:hypothetical protein
MGRTSKFSFPMPGRKARSQQPTEELVLPEEPKLSKVERLLGTTNLPSHYQTLPNRLPPQRDLRRQPSSITLTVYEPTIVDGLSEYGSPIPDVPRIPESSLAHLDAADDRSFNAPPRSLSLSQVNPHAPRHIVEETKRYHPRSQSSSAVPSIRQFRPARSETYSGHAYNPIKESPSAANVRELALGTSASNAHTLFPVVENGTNADYATGSYPLSGYKPGATPAEKKRPTRLDLTNLFSRPSTSSGSALSKAIKSPTSAGYTHNPPRFPSDVRTPSDLASPPLKTSKSRRLAKKPSQAAGRSGDSDNRPKTAGAVNDRPPRVSRANPSKPRASKHWFDGLLEAEDDFNVDFNASSQSPPLSAELSIRPVDASPQYRHQYSQSSHHEPQYTSQQHNSWNQHDTQPFESPVAYNGPARNPLTDSAQRHELLVRKQRSPMVAEFCSLEQDVEDDVPEKTVPIETAPEVKESQDSTLPHLRDSIALSDVEDTDEDEDEAVTIHEAQAFHVGPRRISDAVETVQVKRAAQSIKRIRTVNQSRSQQVSTDTTPMVSPQDETPTNVMDSFFGSSQMESAANDTSTVSRPDSLAARASSILTVGTQRSDQKHKMMAVTVEEEALLAMMRQKRAAMQSHSFAEGYKTAMMSSPQSPVFQNSQRDSGNISINSYSKMNPSYETRPPLFHSSTDFHRLDTSYQRRGSEPMVVVAPKPTRVFKPQSISTIDNNKFCQTMHSYRPSTATTMSITEDSFSIPPEMAHSGLSSSPSDKSGMSGLPSPVTPHSMPTNNGVHITVAVGTANSDSSNSIAELREEDIFDMPKSHAENEVSHQGREAQNTLFANVPFVADRIITNDETPKAQPPKAVQSVQQHKHLASAYESESSEAIGQNYASGHASHPHKHHQGCCGSAQVRCSVADDVMAAWSSLGGFQEIERYQLY